MAQLCGRGVSRTNHDHRITNANGPFVVDGCHLGQLPSASLEADLKLHGIWSTYEFADVGARLAGSCELAGHLPDLQQRPSRQSLQRRKVDRNLLAEVSWAEAEVSQGALVEDQNLPPAPRLLLPVSIALEAVVHKRTDLGHCGGLLSVLAENLKINDGSAGSRGGGPFRRRTGLAHGTRTPSLTVSSTCSVIGERIPWSGFCVGRKSTTWKVCNRGLALGRQSTSMGTEKSGCMRPCCNQ